MQTETLSMGEGIDQALIKVLLLLRFPIEVTLILVVSRSCFVDFAANAPTGCKQDTLSVVLELFKEVLLLASAILRFLGQL